MDTSNHPSPTHHSHHAQQNPNGPWNRSCRQTQPYLPVRSSTVSPVCRMMLRSVPLGTSRCMGTVVCRPSAWRSVAWLPRCRIITNPFRSRRATTRLAVTEGRRAIWSNGDVDVVYRHRARGRNLVTMITHNFKMEHRGFLDIRKGLRVGVTMRKTSGKRRDACAIHAILILFDHYTVSVFAFAHTRSIPRS